MMFADCLKHCWCSWERCPQNFQRNICFGLQFERFHRLKVSGLMRREKIQVYVIEMDSLENESGWPHRLNLLDVAMSPKKMSFSLPNALTSTPIFEQNHRSCPLSWNETLDEMKRLPLTSKDLHSDWSSLLCSFDSKWMLSFCIFWWNLMFVSQICNGLCR